MKTIVSFLFFSTLIFSLTTTGWAEGEDQVFQLGDVVVSTERETNGNITTVSKITAEEIKAGGAQTLDEALRMVPGVDVDNGSKGEMHINIRGFDQSDLKVLIDGVPTHEAYYRNLDLGQFPVESIAEIKIIKGASSLMYGANTMGGVINIITKKGTDDPTLSAAGAWGDYNTQHYAYNHGRQIGPINYFVTYAYQNSEGFRLSDDFDPEDPEVGLDSDYQEDGGMRDLSDYERHALTAKVGYDVEDTQVYFSFNYNNNERGVPTESSRFWHFSKWDQWHVNLVAQQDIGDIVTLRARGYYVDHQDTLHNYTDKTRSEFGGAWFDKSSYDDYSAGGEIQSLFRIMDLATINLGLNYIYDQHKQQDYNPKRKNGSIITPGWTEKEIYETRSYSVAMEAEGYAGPLTFVGGVSYDRYEPVKSSEAAPVDPIDEYCPQGGFFLNLNDDKTIIHGSAGQKIRFPHMKELYSSKGGGNPDIKHQRTLAYEIGIGQRLDLPDLPVQVNVTYFYNNVKNLIDKRDVPDPADPTDTMPLYINIGKSTIEGVEASFSCMPIERLLSRLNYTYLWTEDKELDRPLVETPRHKINMDLSYHMDSGLTLNSQTTYCAEQETYDIDDGEVENKRHLPNYFLWDAKISKEFWEHYKIFAQVTNITDINYDEGHGPLPGRTFMLGYEVTW